MTVYISQSLSFLLLYISVLFPNNINFGLPQLEKWHTSAQICSLHRKHLNNILICFTGQWEAIMEFCFCFFQLFFQLLSDCCASAMCSFVGLQIGSCHFHSEVVLYTLIWKDRWSFILPHFQKKCTLSPSIAIVDFFPLFLSVNPNANLLWLLTDSGLRRALTLLTALSIFLILLPQKCGK